MKKVFSDKQGKKSNFFRGIKILFSITPRHLILKKRLVHLWLLQVTKHETTSVYIVDNDNDFL
jgi:hypothetical protein